MLHQRRVRGCGPFIMLALVAALASGARHAIGQTLPAAATQAASAAAEQQAPTLLPVNGTVVDDRTGLPVAEFIVTWGDEHSFPFWQHADARRFTDGRFTYDPPKMALYWGRQWQIQVRANGYKAVASRVIRSTERDVKLDFRLAPAKPISAQVFNPDGTPASGATVLAVMPGNLLEISNGAPVRNDKLPFGDQTRSTTTDAAGRFQIDIDGDHCRLAVVCDAGFANLILTPLTREVRLTRWGSVQCSVKLDGRPASAMQMVAQPHDRGDDGPDDASIEFNSSARTGSDGRCTLEHVPSGRMVVAIQEPRDFGHRNRYWGNSDMRQTPIEVQAGGAATVRIGGGAEVVGRFTTGGRNIPWQHALARLYPASLEPKTTAPTTLPTNWRDEVLQRYGIPVEIRPDGTFRATDVPPGGWRLDSMIFLEQKGTDWVRFAGDTSRRFRVSAFDANPTGTSATNIGEVPVEFVNLLEAGDAAPDFEVVTLDGKRLRLSALRGKYVVLDFWATWCGPCKAELPFLKESWEKLKNQPDVVILGLSIDETDAPVRPFIAEHGYSWTHAMLGEKSKVAADYGVRNIPQMWLVLPNGTLASAKAEALAQEIAEHRRTSDR